MTARPDRAGWYFAAWVVALLQVLIPASASAAAMQTLHYATTAVVARLKPAGRLDAERHLRLAISLPLRNQQALADLLRQLQDPASQHYHKYLTPTQFARRFGPSERDYAAVAAFAQAHGLAVTRKHPNRVIMDVEGAVPDIETAFHFTMRTYRHPREHRQFYAPDADPALDLPVPVLGISGLDNYEPPRPRLRINSIAAPAFGETLPHPRQNPTAPNAGSGPDGLYAGDDFRAAYVPGATLTGSGQTAALVEFDGYSAGDITYYESLTGSSNVRPTNILLDGFSGTPASLNGQIEVSLDIEMIIAMAPQVSNILVYEAGPNGDWHDILNCMATDGFAKEISCSWYSAGAPADPVADEIFQQMAAQGQSFFSASGDDDAYTGLIPFPGDTPYITEVGGTMLTTNGAGGPFASEAVWNSGGGSGSGGGISTQYAIPVWQQGVNMRANLGSTTMRNTPDVALTAQNVYVRANAEDWSVGGTSCAAPLWAAFIALVNQEAVANARPMAGFVNPSIYAIATGTDYGAAFHDTTAGNNFSPSSPAQFPAVTGYDLCTGWGSPAGNALIYALAGPPTPIISTGSPLPNGAVGIAYNQTLATGGGAPPYTWSITAGALPGGLSLNGSDGVISGTPVASGSAGFTVQVTDTNGISSETAFSLTVYSQGTPIIATASPLATGTLGVAYSQTLTASGGATPYTWTVFSGAVTPGLALSNAGVLSGTPTATGSFGFTVQVIGSDGLDSTTPFSMFVPPLSTIFSALTATGTNGAAFSYQITAWNNPTGYGASGLPAGLSVDPVTGLISGTATATGTTNATISAVNIGGTASATLAIVIAQMPPPVLIWPFTTVATFNTANGANPTAGLVQGTDGNLYGTTLAGGLGYGNIFRITPDGSLTNIASFNGTNGYAPVGGLVEGPDGSFYGTTEDGNGLGNVFKITTSGSITSLYSFDYGSGALPAAGLITGRDGNFYGTTLWGGDYGYGTIFEITPSGSLTTLYSFDYSDGYGPSGGLAQGSNGSLCGTAQQGGSSGDGTVFQITPNGSLASLYSFSGGDGNEPLGGLTLGSDGNFYGTTVEGGYWGAGTVFQMTPDGSLTTYYSFSGDDGLDPVGGILQGSDGNYYGTTYAGGAANDGTVFQMTPDGSLTTLYSFSGMDGENPEATLFQASSGIYYGTTYAGGANGAGTVFSLTPFDVTVIAGRPFSYQITDISNAPPSYSAGNLPTGLNVNMGTGLITGTPTVPGTNNVTISATNAGGAGTAILTITVVASGTFDSFAAWQTFWFTPAQLADPTISGVTAAPAGDNIANLLKYAFNLNPFVYPASGLPIGSMTAAGGNNYLTLTYTQDIYAADITYTPEVSGDMRTWNSGPGYVAPVSVTPNADGVTETVVVQDLTPVAPGTPEFIRLNVSGQ